VTKVSHTEPNEGKCMILDMREVAHGRADRL
jgi:hypothetical protein